MKSIKCLLIVLLSIGSLTFIFGQTSFSFGGGIPYNFTAKTPGINVRAYHNLGEHFCYGPEFTYFFKETTQHNEEEITTSIWELNLNAHYIFEINEHLGIYPIVGLNFTKESEDITALDTGHFSTEIVDAFGINLGAGFHVPFEKVIPFVEYEYVAGNLSEHILTAGFFIMFGKDKQENDAE